jgi:hypothetical protein
MSKPRAELLRQGKNLKEREEKEAAAEVAAGVALAENRRLQREEPERYAVAIKDKGMDLKTMQAMYKDITKEKRNSKLKKAPLQDLLIQLMIDNRTELEDNQINIMIANRLEGQNNINGNDIVMRDDENNVDNNNEGNDGEEDNNDNDNNQIYDEDESDDNQHSDENDYDDDVEY